MSNFCRCLSLSICVTQLGTCCFFLCLSSYTTQLRTWCFRLFLGGMGGGGRGLCLSLCLPRSLIWVWVTFVAVSLCLSAFLSWVHAAFVCLSLSSHITQLRIWCFRWFLLLVVMVVFLSFFLSSRITNLGLSYFCCCPSLSPCINQLGTWYFCLSLFVFPHHSTKYMLLFAVFVSSHYSVWDVVLLFVFFLLTAVDYYGCRWYGGKK